MNTDVCINCMYSNNKLSKIENGMSFTWCRKHRQHVSPTDACEFYKSRKKEAENETDN